MKPIAAAVCVLPLAACAVTVPTNGQHVTPQRPTLSSDTNTTAENTIEVEGGVFFDPGDGWSTPTSLKYGFDERTEVFVGWVPIHYDDDRDVTVVGSSQVGIRHRYEDGDGEGVPSAAVQALVNLPTGNSGVGLSEMEFSLAGIVSGTADDVGWTGYGSIDLVSDPSDAGVDPGFSLALAGSFDVDQEWTPFAEIAGIVVPERDIDIVFTTLGAFFPVAADLAFDVGMVVGLSKEAPDFALVFGFTRNFGSVSRMARGELH